MGKMERGAKKRTSRGAVESAVLTSLAAAGVVLVAMAAPNTLQLLKYADPDWLIKRDPKQRIREAANRLKKKKLVRFVPQNGRVFLRITEKGSRLLHTLTFSKAPLPKPRRWDRKWRLVIFDIPERRRADRNKARALMSRLGFVHLQDSVWAYPYDCEEIVTLLKTELRLGKDLLYIIADAIEYDKHLRIHFDLPTT